MQDNYTDIQLVWPDINAASKLCHKGICLYNEKDGSGLTDEWIAVLVTPAIQGVFGDGIA